MKTVISKSDEFKMNSGLNSNNKIKILKYKKDSMRMNQPETFFMKQKDIYLIKLFSHKGLSNAVKLISPRTHSKVLLPKLNFDFDKNLIKSKKFDKKIKKESTSRNLFKSYSMQNKLSLSNKTLKPIPKFSIVLSPVHIRNNICLNSSINITSNNTTMNRNVNVNKKCVIKFSHKSENTNNLLIKGTNVNEQGSQTTFYNS